MPASANDRPCSGKGTPVAVMGQCLCFTGWSGAGCDSCAEGYAPLAGVCQRTRESFAAEAKLNARRRKVDVGCMSTMPS
jgi:EGF-like domain